MRVPVASRLAWILACGCEPMVEHCEQCYTRRTAVALTQLEEAVQRACEDIYEAFDGYWPNQSERARIAVALLSDYRKAVPL